MADLGQLKQYVDEYDLTWKFGNKTYRLKPDFKDVLRFKHAWFSRSLDGPVAERQMDMFVHVGELVGSPFDTKTMEFGGGPLGDMQAKGVDYTTLSTLVDSIWLFYMNGQETVQKYLDSLKGEDTVKGTDSPKGESKKNATPRKTETHTGAGETD